MSSASHAPPRSSICFLERGRVYAAAQEAAVPKLEFFCSRALTPLRHQGVEAVVVMRKGKTKRSSDRDVTRRTKFI